MFSTVPQGPAHSVSLQRTIERVNETGSGGEKTDKLNRKLPVYVIDMRVTDSRRSAIASRQLAGALYGVRYLQVQCARDENS